MFKFFLLKTIVLIYFSLVYSSDQISDLESSCKLEFQMEYDLKQSKQTDEFNAYAGNGFGYDLNCHVIDPRTRTGDKYYVIDMVLYGPNSRVAKAWREQFTTLSFFKGRNLSLNKKVTFNWVGLNSVICSVSKYNNLVNKFTKICEKKIQINATENLDKTTRSFQNTKFDNLNQLSELQRLVQKQRKALFKNNTNNQLNDLNPKSNESYPNYQIIADMNDSKLNYTAKAMQYRNIYIEKKIYTQTVAKSKQNHKQESSDDLKMAKNFNILQPLSIILIFVIIFSISIGTIIYLTYNQKEYNNVKTVDDHVSEDLATSQTSSRANTINNTSTISNGSN